MTKKLPIICLVPMFAATMALSGCETTAGSAGTGAALGGIAGGIIGNQSGNTLEGAAIGAALGGLAGIIVKDVQDRRLRGPEETYEQYPDYDPGVGLNIYVDSLNLSQSQVRPGGTIESRFQYAVVGAGSNGIAVRERLLLMRGDRVIKELRTETVTRTDGTWENLVVFEVPRGAEAGTYSLLAQVEAGNLPAKGTERAFTVVR